MINLMYSTYWKICNENIKFIIQFKLNMTTHFKESKWGITTMYEEYWWKYWIFLILQNGYTWISPIISITNNLFQYV